MKNIREKATNAVSFISSEASGFYPEYYLSPVLSRIEDSSIKHVMNPNPNTDWKIFAFDESTQNYRALEGDLFFYSSAVIKLDSQYLFDLQVSPYFFSSMKKFDNQADDCILYAKNIGEKRNEIMIQSKVMHIVNTVEDNSIILIDGPLIGGNSSHYYVEMDNKLRAKNCIPLYFIKNSSSRLIIDNERYLQNEYNNDFHWASRILGELERTPFFKYTDSHNINNSKVFTYIKALRGFPERIEMHAKTYEKYGTLISDLFDLIAYYFIAQGDFSNPQVRPIAIAEKYAREGLKMLNIPVLLGKMGFHPTINQVRFG